MLKAISKAKDEALSEEVQVVVRYVE